MTINLETVSGAQAKATAAKTAAYQETLAAVAGMFEPKRAFGPSRIFWIGDYLNGAAMPNQRGVDIKPFWEAAATAAAAWVAMVRAADPANFGAAWAQVRFPEGEFDVRTTLNTYDGVGILAPGSSLSKFWLLGGALFQSGRVVDAMPAEGWFFYDRQRFVGFTVNGRHQGDPDENGQSASPGYGALKAFYYQNARDLYAEDVILEDIYASEWGIDFITRGYWFNCHIRNGGNGQGVDTDEEGPTTSGFAPGLGRFLDESGTYVFCTAAGCIYGGGWLFEQLKGRGGYFQPDQWKVIACDSNFNKFGMADLGAGGVLVLGGDFGRNTHSNILVSGSQDRDAGKRGRIIATKLNGAGGNTHGPGTAGNGIMFVNGASPTDYQIDTDIFGNANAGVYVHESCKPTVGGLKIKGRIEGNAYGVKIENTGNRLKGLDIDATFGVNTIADVWTDAGLIMPVFNTKHNGSPIGIRFSPDRPTTKPVLQSTFLDVAQPIVNEPSDKSNWRVIEYTSIEKKLPALAGVAPIFLSTSKSGIGDTTTTGLSFNTSGDMTAYVVVDAVPGSNEIVLSLRNSDAASLMSVTRKTGDAAWTVSTQDSTGTTKTAEVTSPAGKAVLAVVRKAGSLTLHVAGVGSSAATTLTGVAANSIIVSALRRSKSVFAVAFPGEFSDTVRNASLAALAAEFITL